MKELFDSELSDSFSAAKRLTLGMHSILSPTGWASLLARIHDQPEIGAETLRCPRKYCSITFYGILFTAHSQWMSILAMRSEDLLKSCLRQAIPSQVTGTRNETWLSYKACGGE